MIIFQGSSRLFAIISHILISIRTGKLTLRYYHRHQSQHVSAQCGKRRSWNCLFFLSSPPHAIRSSAKKVNTSSRHFLLSQLTGAEPTNPDRRQQDTQNDWGLYVIRRLAWKADIGRGSHVLSPTGSVDVVPLSRGSTSCRKSDIKLMSVDVNSQHKAYLWLIYDSIYLW